jgi:hypothetical protein
VSGPQPPAVPAAQVSAVLAWAARLAAAGPAASATIETAAYLTAKAAVLERIAAEREQGVESLHFSGQIPIMPHLHQERQ